MPVGDYTMIHKLTALIIAWLVFLPSKGNAENIVCPPQYKIAEEPNKWSPDYVGLLEEVWLSRQFLKESEGAVIRCKRTIGSVEMFLLNKSCRIVSGGGKSSTTSYGTNTEDTACKMSISMLVETNDKVCMVVCR